MKKRQKTRPRHKHRGKSPAAPVRAVSHAVAVSRKRAQGRAWELWRSVTPSFEIPLSNYLPRLSPSFSSARAVADTYRSDEREALGLLLLPFLLLAFGIGMSQSIRPHRASDWVLPPMTTAEAPRHRIKLPMAEAGRLTEPARTTVARNTTVPALVPSSAAGLPPAAVESIPGAVLAPVATPPSRVAALATPSSARAAPNPPLASSVATRELAMPAAVAEEAIAEHRVSSPAVTATTARPAGAAAPTSEPPSALQADMPAPEVAKALASEPAAARIAAAAVPDLAPFAGRPEPLTEARAERLRLAALAPPPTSPLNVPEAPSLAPLLPDVAILARPERQAPGTDICAIEDKPKLATSSTPDMALARDPALFGERLAQAARAQLDELVVYNDAYRRISYPMGDVPALFGVCTDVVIRAYRALGIDLQALVHTSRAGSGDTNIDHRRVETLRRFLATRGTSVPVTDFPEDYRPGDIVTYYRPQNRHSRSHIAIVADVTGPSGRPMILHNRGWGVQLEDGLFVDQITGHYRFAAAPAPMTPPAGKVVVIDAATAGVTKGARCLPVPGARQPPQCSGTARGRHLQARSGPLPHAQ